MRLRWTHAIVPVVAILMVGVGFSFGKDDGSALEKIMEDVNKNNNVIRKGVRTAASYKKDREALAESSKLLIELAGKTKTETAVAEKAGKKKEWEEFSDEFKTASEALFKICDDANSKQADAKTAFADLGKTCTKCHEVFRVDSIDP